MPRPAAVSNSHRSGGSGSWISDTTAEPAVGRQRQMGEVGGRPDRRQLPPGAVEPHHPRPGRGHFGRIDEQIGSRGEEREAGGGKALDVRSQNGGLTPELQGLRIALRGHEVVATPEEEEYPGGRSIAFVCSERIGRFSAACRGRPRRSRRPSSGALGSGSRLAHLVEEAAAIREGNAASGASARPPPCRARSPAAACRRPPALARWLRRCSRRRGSFRRGPSSRHGPRRRRPARGAASGEGDASTTFSLPLAKKPSARLSGDQKT